MRKKAGAICLHACIARASPYRTGPGAHLVGEADAAPGVQHLCGLARLQAQLFLGFLVRVVPRHLQPNHDAKHEQLGGGGVRQAGWHKVTLGMD